MDNPSNQSRKVLDMDNSNIIRPLFGSSRRVPASGEVIQEIENSEVEARRVISRLSAILEEHMHAAKKLHIDLDSNDLVTVINSLRKHARGTNQVTVTGGKNEVHDYCLNRLFEELVEEPSNILFTTHKGSETVRYDAMNAGFWIQCLDLLERTLCWPK